MGLYYVNSEIGTRTTGGAITDQSGNSFATIGAANCYASLVLAMADATSSANRQGDIIYVSDAHSHNNGGSAITYSPGDGSEAVQACQVICVEDGDAGVESSGAKEDTSSAIAMSAADSWITRGMIFESSSNILCNTDTVWKAVNCEFRLMAAGSSIGSVSDGSVWDLTNCTIYNNDIAAQIEIRGGGVFKMFGGQFTSISVWTNLYDVNMGQNGGAHLEFRGVDMSTVTDIPTNHGSVTIDDDPVTTILDKCRISSATALAIEETKNAGGLSIKATNCSSVSADAEWQRYEENQCGSVTAVDTSSVVRVDTDTTRVFPGGETIAFKVQTTAHCSPSDPFYFDLPASYMQLSNAASDTIAIYFAWDNVTPDDVDIYAEVVAMDGTNKQVANFYSNQGDIVAGGTAHTDDSGSSVWEDNSVALGGTWNEFVMKVDTTTDPAADCVPTVRVCVTTPSIADDTLYVAMHVDAVAS